MAGMLPGVGVPHRRRPRQEITARGNSDISLRERREPSIMAMDETAQRARLRLEQRLAHLFSSSSSSSSRSSDRQRQDGGHGRKRSKAHIKDSRRSGTRFLGMPWKFQLNKCKSIETCSVCLEDLQDEQRVMNLSCSHKY